MRKYMILLSSVFILLVLGATYTYSVFLESFTTTFSVSKSLGSIPFSIFLFSYAFGMAIAGRLYPLYSPRVLTLLGGCLFSLGFILSSFAESLFQLSIFYGFLGGFGLSLAYVTPITLVSEWFVEKKGLASGITISAFGLGSFFLSPLSSSLITKLGWRLTLRYEGIVFLLIILISSLSLIRVKKATFSTSKTVPPITLSRLLKHKTFWILWTSYAFALTTGLMIMGHIVPLYREIFSISVGGAALIGIIAIFNALGRIAFGALGDLFSPIKLLKFSYFLQAAVFLLLLLSYKTPILLYAATPLFGFCFGGWLVLFPVLSSDCFGMESLSTVYGTLFTSYGIAGIIGPICIAFIQGVTGSYVIPLLFSLFLCSFAGMLLFALPKSKKG